MFNKRIKKLRGETGLTQEEFSNRLGIARTTYSGYERGTSEPDIATLLKFADYFDVTIDYLVGRTDDRKMWFKSEDEKTIYDIMNLSDDKSLDAISMTYDGFELNLEEKREFLAIARGIFDARKSLKQDRLT